MLSINFKDSVIAYRQLFDFEPSVRLESTSGGFVFEGVRNAQDRTQAIGRMKSTVGWDQCPVR